MILGSGELLEFGVALHVDAERIQVLLKQALGVALRKHEGVGVRRVYAVESDASDLFATGNDIGGCDFEAGIDEG